MSDITYNNEFCIVRENSTNAIIIDELLTARVETMQQIEKHTTLNTVPPAYFPALPNSGWIEKKMYNYNNKTVCCIQPHNRTIYPPEQTPALFSFYREDTGNLQWIEGEAVAIGAKRIYNGVKYNVIQPHQTQLTWNPSLTVGVLWEVVVTPPANPPQWVSANWGQYVLNYEVLDSGKI